MELSRKDMSEALNDAAQRGDYEMFADLLHAATTRNIPIEVFKLYSSAVGYSE